MVMNLFTDLIEMLFPRYCRVCGNRLGKSESEVCAVCLQKLPRIHHAGKEASEVEKLFWGLMPIERGSSLFYYEKGSPYGKLLFHLKYYGHPLTGEFLGRYAAIELKKEGFFEGIDLLIPLPLSPGRERKRGYNQSEYIANGIALVTGLPIESHCIVRLIANESQTHMSRIERWENVKGIFAVQNGAPLRGKHLLLIDDVLTTGATLRSCGNEILAAVPDARISIFTLALARRSI